MGGSQPYSHTPAKSSKTARKRAFQPEDEERGPDQLVGRVKVPDRKEGDRFQKERATWDAFRKGAYCSGACLPRRVSKRRDRGQAHGKDRDLRRISKTRRVLLMYVRRHAVSCGAEGRPWTKAHWGLRPFTDLTVRRQMVPDDPGSNWRGPEGS